LVTGLGSALVVRTNLTLLNQGRQIDQFTIRDGGLVAVTNQAGNGTMTVRPEYLTVDGGRLAADELEVWAAPRGWRVMAFKSGRLEVRNLTSRGSTNHEPISVGDGLGIETAVLELRGGRLVATNGLHLLPDAELAGSGNLVGAVTNRGTIAPQHGGGGFQVAGPLRTEGAVRLTLGAAAGAGAAPIVLTSPAQLGGRLLIELAAGFEPGWTNRLRALSWPSWAGQFTNAPPGSRLAVGQGSFRVHYLVEGLELGDYRQDLDGDGIDDLWARTYFGHSPLTSEEREGDNDQDGLSARAEAVAGTDPSDPASGLRLRLERRMPVGLALRFGEVPGKWYRLWVSSDLQGWQELAAPRFTRPAPGVAEWVAEVDGLPPDGLSGGVPRRYYRVSVE